MGPPRLSRSKEIAMPRPVLSVFLLALLLAPAAASACPDPEAMIGRWDMTVVDRRGEIPAWFELAKGPDGVTMRMMYRFGAVRTVERFEISEDGLRFEVPALPGQEVHGPDFCGRFNGRWFRGTTLGPPGSQLHWTAVRAPRLERRPEPRWGRPITLFNGSDLTGWRPRDPMQPPGWSIEDGVLTSRQPCGDLVTKQRFRDFKLHVECLLPPGGDSGIHLRGRYEVQVTDGGAGEPPEGVMGSIYGHIAPVLAASLPAGQWQTFDITLVGRRVTVVLNGATIIADQEIPGITGDALDAHEGKPGPIMLQGRLGEVSFRNIVLTPAQ
jgi:hypothetical protein